MSDGPPTNGYAARLTEHDRRLGIIEPRLDGVVGDIREIRTHTGTMAQDIHEMKESVARREIEDEKDREKEAALKKQEARDRILDRRWRIGTVIAIVVALITAAQIISTAL